MIIDEVLHRNSGATLEPCIYKHGVGCLEQGRKMALYPAVFAPVLVLTTDGYVMPWLQQPTTEADLQKALRRLATLWLAPGKESQTDRAHHHATQVEPYTANATQLLKALDYWVLRAQGTHGKTVLSVHGDPTLENYMAGGVWLDPSVRPLPLEAELDGGKLLQSYFGYERQAWPEWRRKCIRDFLKDQGLDLDLCAYYLVTHIVRLYRVQPQARTWSLDLLANLEERMGELR
jgi:hypothetical protein